LGRAHAGILGNHEAIAITIIMQLKIREYK
jgi:septum formation inhibitor MinC